MKKKGWKIKIYYMTAYKNVIYQKGEFITQKFYQTTIGIIWNWKISEKIYIVLNLLLHMKNKL